jgi:hypothetical protein
MDLKKAMVSLAAVCLDERINVWHISAYTAIIQLWYKGGFTNPVFITRKKIMELSHIGSIATYHKCIRELEHYGYIRYEPSYHPLVGSKISLLRI